MNTKPLQRQYIIEQLSNLRVTKGPNGEVLGYMDYYKLRRFLAVERAVRE